MLEMRPDCERCGCDLPAGGPAFICSFECSFCPDCATGCLNLTCPNCGGQLEMRPTRSPDLLERFPASTIRRSG